MIISDVVPRPRWRIALRGAAGVAALVAFAAAVFVLGWLTAAWAAAVQVR